MLIHLWTELEELPEKEKMHQLEQMQQYAALLPPARRCPCHRLPQWLQSSEQHWTCCPEFARPAKSEIAWNADAGDAWGLSSHL